MNHRKKFDLHKFFVVSAIFIGVGFFLTSLLLTRIVFNEKENEIPKADPRAAEVSQWVTQLPSRNSQTPARRNVDTVPSETEDSTETFTEAENSPIPEDASTETPLSYEEELRQRWRDFTQTSEYKEYSRKFSELSRKSNEASAPIETATIKWNEYMANPYSVLGLTKAEGDKTEWSEEEQTFMEEEGRKLKQQLDEYVTIQRELFRQMSDLVQWTKDLVGMTDEEYYIAIGRPSPPPAIPKKDADLIR